MKYLYQKKLLFILCFLIPATVKSQSASYTVELIAETKDKSLLTQVLDLDLRTDTDGQTIVYIADVFTPAVLVMKKEEDKLILTDRLGREGMGPGEYIELTNVESMPEGNSLMAYDGNLARATLLDIKTNDVQRVFNLYQTRGRHFPMEFYTSGTRDSIFFARGEQFFSDDYDPAGQRNMLLQKYNQEGVLTSDSVLVKPSDEAFVFRGGGNMAVNPQPVWGRKSIFQFKENHIYYVWTGNPELVIYDQQGRHIKTVPLQGLPQLKMTEEDRNLALDREATMMDERKSVLRKSYYEAMPNDFWPWIHDFIIDEKGRAWIALPDHLNSKTRTWQIRNLDGEGDEVIGQVQLPSDFKVHQIKSDIIAGELFNFVKFSSTVQLYQIRY